jgi:hypothetical protein
MGHGLHERATDPRRRPWPLRPVASASRAACATQAIIRLRRAAGLHVRPRPTRPRSLTGPARRAAAGALRPWRAPAGRPGRRRCGAWPRALHWHRDTDRIRCSLVFSHSLSFSPSGHFQAAAAAAAAVTVTAAAQAFAASVSRAAPDRVLAIPPPCHSDP